MRSRDEIKVFLKDMQQKPGMSMLDRAKAFAEFAHDGQRDKAGMPYIGHINRVGENTAKAYNNDILTAIAYMHDVIEDGNLSVNDMSVFFPRAVWAVVDVLTRKKSEGREEYIDDISKNYLATLVKLIDLSDNMDLTRLPYVTDKDYERQSRYISEYHLLTDALDKMQETLSADEKDPEMYEYLYM